MLEFELDHKLTDEEYKAIFDPDLQDLERTPSFTYTYPDGRVFEYVKIVRCKDCINRGTEECAMEYETEDGEYIWNEDQDFCSWGEREEDGGR